MNFFRNPLRQHLPSLRKLIFDSPIESRAFSTVTEPSPSEITDITSISEQEQELDKLYKRVELELRGNDPAVLKSYSWFANTACTHLGCEIGRSWAHRKPTNELYTVQKSVHVHKKHKVQYHVRTYYRFIHLHRMTGSTCDTVLEYLQRNMPEGVSMKATKVEIQRLPDYIKNPPSSENQN